MSGNVGGGGNKMLNNLFLLLRSIQYHHELDAANDDV